MSGWLEGSLEGPDHEINWRMVDEELHRHFDEQLSPIGAFLDGCATYELMAAFWLTTDQDPLSTAPVAAVALN